MNISSATNVNAVHQQSFGEDIKTIYNDIQERILQASMFNRSLNAQREQCQNVYETFQADLAKNKGDYSEMSKIASIAKKALLDIEWDLDKRITISQIQISYDAILRSINLSPDDDLDEIDAEAEEITEISLALAKQARDIKFRAMEEIDEAQTKASLQTSAFSAYQALVRIRSSLIKEKTFYQLQTLIDRIILQESENQEIVDKATNIFNEAKVELYLEDENIVITPDQASRFIVGVAQKLTLLAPQNKGD